jgi:hypothetical protein
MGGFEKTLGFNHTVEEEHTKNGLKVTLRVVLPKAESRYEPENFRLKELALERLADTDPAKILYPWRGSTKDIDNASFSAMDTEFEAQEKEDIALRAAGGISLFIQGSLFDELSTEATLDVIRLATQIAEHQPSIRYISISKPTERSFIKFQDVQNNVMLQLNGDPSGTATPLSQAREMLEKQRSAFDSIPPMETLMALQSSTSRPIIGGVLPLMEMEARVC